MEGELNAAADAIRNLENATKRTLIANGTRIAEVKSMVIVADVQYFVPHRLQLAKLFAAAPELLDALEAVVRVADRKTVEFDKARAAIAKAKGLSDG